MQVTIDVPDTLAYKLHPYKNNLADILMMGLREWQATAQFRFDSAVPVLEFLATLPTPKTILSLRPTEKLQARMTFLIDKNRTEGLNMLEEQEWQTYQYLEHLVRLARVNAMKKLQGDSSHESNIYSQKDTSFGEYLV